MKCAVVCCIQCAVLCAVLPEEDASVLAFLSLSGGPDSYKFKDW